MIVSEKFVSKKIKILPNMFRVTHAIVITAGLLLASTTPKVTALTDAANDWLNNTAEDINNWDPNIDDIFDFDCDDDGCRAIEKGVNRTLGTILAFVIIGGLACIAGMCYFCTCCYWVRVPV